MILQWLIVFLNFLSGKRFVFSFCFVSFSFNPFCWWTFNSILGKKKHACITGYSFSCINWREMRWCPWLQLSPMRTPASPNPGIFSPFLISYILDFINNISTKREEELYYGKLYIYSPLVITCLTSYMSFILFHSPSFYVHCVYTHLYLLHEHRYLHIPVSASGLTALCITDSFIPSATQMSRPLIAEMSSTRLC